MGNWPPLPHSIKTAGNTVPAPTSVRPGAETRDLVTRLHQSDVRNARAANQCKARDAKLKKLYHK